METQGHAGTLKKDPGLGSVPRSIAKLDRLATPDRHGVEKAVRSALR